MTIRRQIMDAHRALSLGSPEDMKAARLVLYLLRKGRITLGLSDPEWQVQNLLEGLGVPLYISRNGYTASAKI